MLVYTFIKNYIQLNDQVIHISKMYEYEIAFLLDLAIKPWKGLDQQINVTFIEYFY